MITRRKQSRGDFSEAEITSTLEAGIEQADQERAQAFRFLGLLRAARVRGRERQLQQLASRFPADQEQPARVMAKLERDRRLQKAFRVEEARQSVAPPTPQDGTWILHGHVLNNELDPVEGVTSVLVTPSGAPVRTQGGRTDSSGYFKLSMPAPTEEVTPEEDSKEPGTPSNSRRAVKSEPVQVIVRIVGARSAVLFESDSLLAPVGTGIEYTEIVLKDHPKGHVRRSGIPAQRAVE